MRAVARIDGVGDLFHRPFAVGVVDADPCLESEAVGAREGRGQVVDGTAGHADGGERLEPGVRGAGAQRAVERGQQFGAVGDAVRIGGEAGILGEFRKPQFGAEGRELPVVAHREGQRTVLGVHHLVRRDRRMAVAHGPRHHARGHIGRCLVGQRGQQRGEQGHLHPLPRAGAVPVAQGGQDAHPRVQTGDDVHQGDTGLGALAVRFAGHAHQPAHGLHQQVVAGQRGSPTGSETGHRAVHQPGVDRPQLLVAETEALHRPGPEVLHEHVRARGDLPGGAAVVFVGQVQDDGAFLAVDTEEVGRFPVGVRGTPGPGLVAAAGPLDLDDLGAEVGEQHGQVRRREHAAEVGHDDPGQGPGRHRVIRRHAASLSCLGRHRASSYDPDWIQHPISRS